MGAFQCEWSKQPKWPVGDGLGVRLAGLLDAWQRLTEGLVSGARLGYQTRLPALAPSLFGKQCSLFREASPVKWVVVRIEHLCVDL